ncbi:ATP-dependent RNA helicase-like protein rok1 [Ampelomyces quisqualis]|uniref:ATP-dependent RNA helicase ROK1 n=1 Tax=Ampelomyces quisqualis TaxID=50730 RepID=A0A6A5QHX0_AMPQU|nr:ATP-dependent RNA helicase-like protein rok1 [Ampelomyces quisqualis]
MNVFKLLSRSSKALQNPPVQKLPSSGAVANPQLFGHDDEPAQSPQSANTSRKRKRGTLGVEPCAESTGALPADLDFFAGAKSSNGGGDGKARREEKKLKALKEKEAAVDEPYDAEECKRILRSHKLKVAVLEDFAPKESKKKSEKRKKDKHTVQNKKKGAKTQLFPRPLTSFAQLRTRYGISKRLAENLQEQGYKLPTEVQLGALPLLLAKRGRGEQNGATTAEASSGEQFGGDVDLLTVAPTGSGKTIAFLIPIINALLAENKELDGKEGPKAVVLAPTRELASQIVNEARKLAKGTGIKATLMRKGMEVVKRSEQELSEDANEMAEASEDENSGSESDREEETAARKTPKRRQAELVKAAILVATPLALLNSLKRKDGTVADLSSVRHLVLDEADVLLDPLFREQTVATWSACSNPLLRVGLWSATMGSNIDDLTISIINSRWENLSSTIPRPPLLRLVVGLKDTAIPNISHQLIYAATEQGKLLGLRQLLHPTTTTSEKPTVRPPFLVFTQTIPRAIALHSELRYDIPPEAGGSSRIAVLHADLSPSARDAVMTSFRKGETWILITTNLLSRGIDFRGLNGVVNFDAPTSPAAYVHRVGRTGRAGRHGGCALTFYTAHDIPHIKSIANVIHASEKARRGPAPAHAPAVEQWLLDALPDVGKRARNELRRRGVESRRAGAKAARISTKSGFERRVEKNRRGAREAGKRRVAVVQETEEDVE